MAKSNWKVFPHADKGFDYAGYKLAKAWPKLHAGDQETFPDEKHVAIRRNEANSKPSVIDGNTRSLRIFRPHMP